MSFIRASPAEYILDRYGSCFFICADLDVHTYEMLHVDAILKNEFRRIR